MEDVVLASEDLEVAVTPETGCSIRQVRHRATGWTVLWQTPWTTQPALNAGPVGDSVTSWLRSYPGGWQLLLPNAGDPCTVEGVTHAFHGEASTSRWEWESGDGWLRARLDCYALPLRIDRHITVTGTIVTVTDEVTNTGTDHVRFMWGHHPGFGGDLLEGGVTIEIAGRRVRTDADYDPPGNALAPGEISTWPKAPGRENGTIDLRIPVQGRSAFACVDDLAEGWARITRTDGLLSAELRWDADTFPSVWLWEELGGSTGAPWFGRGRVVGIEPCSTWPGHGLARALAEGSPLVELDAGASVLGRVALEVTAAVD
jgi:galactose mutarotase-like enzyme